MMWPFNNKDKKYDQFSSEKSDVKTRFKALISIQKDIGANADRKKWHEANSRQVFTVCRNALDEYAKSPKKDVAFENPQRVCDIINCLAILCQDIPELLIQKWNINAITELLTKFLHYQTNEQVRYEAITLAFVIINNCKDKASDKYIKLLKHSIDFTPFCTEGVYAQYEKNFKQNMIMAPEPIPWVRKGRPNQQHAIRLLKKILDLMLQTSDFDFWYGFLVEHFYPQFFHQCIYDYQHLIFTTVKEDDEKTREITDVESEGFGSNAPPPDILICLVEWLWLVINNEQKWYKIMKTELHMRYLIEIVYRTITLPLNANITIFRILRCIEFWLLGFKVTEEFKLQYQEYTREIMERAALMLDLSNVPFTMLQQKLQLSGFVVYLFRIASGQPYVNWDAQTWEVLISCQLRAVLKIVRNKVKEKDILNQLVYPLIHSLLKSLCLCAIADARTANRMFETMMRKLVKLVEYPPFVIVWREMTRTLTVEVLRFHVERSEEEDDEDDFGNSNKPKDTSYRQSKSEPARSLPSLLHDQVYADFYKQPFEIEDRCQEISVDVFDFSKFEQVHMIWDRMLHLLGNPTKNMDDTSRKLHLEGFTDALKLFIIASYSVPMSKARRMKEGLKRLKQGPMMGSSASLLSVSSSERSLPETSSLDSPKRLDYGFPFSTISVKIETGDLEHFNPAIMDVLPLPPRYLLPQGNTLAYMFSAFLFELCFDLLQKDTTEQESKSQEFDIAFTCLANIFFTPSETTFENEILAQFYKLILESLKSSNASIRKIVIRECANGCLFGKNLQGVHILLPSFFQLVKNCGGSGYKSKNTTTTNTTEMEDRVEDTTDLLIIASSLISFGPHFTTCKITNLKSSNNICEFDDLKQMLLDVYKTASETLKPKPEFANLVISGLTLIIFDELASSRDVKILKMALQCIVNCVSTDPERLDFGTYATRALDGLSIVCSQLVEVGPELITEVLFPTLIRQGLDFIKKATGRNRVICNIASDLIFCLLSWTFNFPPILLQNGDLIGGVIEVLSFALESLHTIPEGKKLHELPPNQQLVVHAKTAMLSLFNYLNNYPLKHDVGAISSNARDIKAPQGMYLVNDNSSIINISDGYVSHERGPERGVRMIIRDDSGKYCWKFTPCSIRARLNHKLWVTNDGRGKAQVHITRERDTNLESQKRKNPIGIDESKAEVESRSNIHTNDSEINSEKKEDIRSAIENICKSTRQRLQSQPTPNLTQYLKDKPVFQYDLVSQKDGLAQVLQYIGGKLHEREKAEETDDLKKFSKTQPVNLISLLTPTTSSSSLNSEMGTIEENKIVTPTIIDTSSTGEVDNNNNYPKILNETTMNSSTSKIKHHGRYSHFGALPSGTLTEQDRTDLFSQLLAHESEEKQLNDKCKSTRDRQSKNSHSLDHNRDKSTTELADSRTTPTNSASTTPVLTGESLSQDNNLLTSDKKMNELDFDPYPQEAMTCLNQFDCSRFLFSHLGLLTSGQTLGVGDYTFSFIDTRHQSGQWNIPSLQATSTPRHAPKITTRKEGQMTRQNMPRPRSDTNPVTIEMLGSEVILEKLDLTKYQHELNEETLGVMPAQEADTVHKRLDLMDRSQNTTREFHKIGVEFVGRDQDHQRYILGNNEGSYSYEKFVDDLGWLADLSVHEGFVGGLAVGSTGRYACYYATGTYEMIFHVATRMPSREGDVQHTERKRHVANDHVNIVWTEHTRTYLPDTISTDFNTVNIVIYPLQSGLFRIQIHKKDNVACFGPLTNNMIVRQHMLAPMVRLTALEANRTVQARDQKLRLSFRERRANLDDYYKKWQRRDGQSLLAGFFPSLNQQ